LTDFTLAKIRTAVLKAPNQQALMWCMYELEGYLSRHPHNVEALTLKGAIERALHYEGGRLIKAPPATLRRYPKQTASLLGVFLIIFAIVIMAYQLFPTSPIECAASPEGDQVSLEAASGRTLLVQVNWIDKTDIDLSVLTPFSTEISYESPVTEDGKLDKDVRTGPGSEKITISKITAGKYRVMVHNFTGMGSPEFRLSVAINNKVSRVYRGKLSGSSQVYILDVEMRK
jgi:hypothetical protein